MTAVIETAISWTVVGGRELLYYPRFAWQINRQQAAGVIEPSNMPNVRGLFAGWKGMNPSSHWVEITLLVTSICLIVWASRQWEPLDLRDTRSWDCGFSVCWWQAYLVGYHGYSHDMSFLLLPLLLALDRVLEALREASRGFKFIVGLMFLSPLYLLLTLQFSHQNLFSIVLLCFAEYLAVSAATVRAQASASRSTTLSSGPLP